MALYSSHIYVESNERLLASLKANPIVSEGLFHLHGVYPSDIETKYKTVFPRNGLIVMREICDPSHIDSEHDEAKVHQHRQDPILSWWNLRGPANLEVLMPSAIPTLAFGKIYIDDKHNPPPPREFLQYLKHLSLSQKVSIAFYHHYSAYEDELANSEYAWIFGKEDTVLIRHVDEAYNTVQYSLDAEPKTIDSDRVGYSQPILKFVMNHLGVSLHRFDNRRPYFYNFRWSNYRV
jgi:hypothetical protein